MKLKLNFPHKHGKKEYQPGEIIDLPDNKAEWLLQQGFPVKTEDQREIRMAAAEKVD